MTQELLGRVYRELLDVLKSINQDEIHHDGDDFHELLRDVKEALAQTQEPVAWFRYQQGSRVYYDSKKWDDCQPLYTQSASEYERGFIDGMQKQMQSSVDKAVNRMAQTQELWCMKMNGCKTKCEDCPDEPQQRTWVGLTDEEENEYNYLGPDMHWVIQEIAAKLKEKNT